MPGTGVRSPAKQLAPEMVTSARSAAKLLRMGTNASVAGSREAVRALPGHVARQSEEQGAREIWRFAHDVPEASELLLRMAHAPCRDRSHRHHRDRQAEAECGDEREAES